MAESLSEWRGPEALADSLGVPLRTIYAWRARGKGPRAHKIGKHLRFRDSDVEAWLATQADDQGAA